MPSVRSKVSSLHRQIQSMNKTFEGLQIKQTKRQNDFLILLQLTNTIYKKFEIAAI